MVCDDRDDDDDDDDTDCFATYVCMISGNIPL
jgi:hypothetical protein